ncbi:thioredoxin-like 1-1, chloroplastic [Cynara cardunculus var. scolymus]|uniref:thioredoxin-like 1-1, chloroplastic n=1 Tax=Cynara cardunculus var. scolymus TaxID=59895 RepID=UPI000D62A150|nr:thioredoxin-like 1-1, chloroplastic [Cynara cardunculus var. scolymus]
MAKIMSNHYKFSACNHGFARNKSDNLSPVMIKMPAASSNLRKSSTVSSAAGDFFGRRVDLGGKRRRVRTQVAAASNAMMSISIGKSLKWWEKGLQPNMKEITGAEDLVESLLRAGDKLVVVDFFSPGCGGCKALHPKICQLAEMNPDVQFLQVNYEDHKSMCYSLNVHVLPFFRFYRGADGRVCSFSCTNATIKKFKDALAKYKPSGCSLGPTKGLDEKDLVELGANRDLSFTYTPKSDHPQTEIVRPPSPPAPSPLPSPSPVAGGLSELPLPRPLKSTSETKEDSKDKTLVSSGR